MGPVVTSRAERGRHVAQMLASSRLEGIKAGETHQQLLQKYIEGTASLADLLNYARVYASHKALAESAYGKMYREYEASNAQPEKKEPDDHEVTALVDAFFRQYRP